MKSRTIYLPPGRVAPGMTLAITVLDGDGHALLAAGAVLDTRTLDRLSRRGIEAIAVLLLDTRDKKTVEKEVLSAETRVTTIFRGVGSSARDELHSAILHYRQQSIK